jgi:hypothetical protein
MIVSAGTTCAKVNIDTSLLISSNKFYDIPMNGVKAGEILNVEIKVSPGGPVDVLLMKSSDHPGYVNAVLQHGTFNYIEEASLKRITSQAYSYKFNDDGDYYLVIDNTDLPKDGGIPSDQVDVRLKVSVVEPAPAGAPKISGFEVVLAGIVIIALVTRKK